MADAATRDVARDLDHSSPADSHAKTGSTLVEVLAQINAITASLNGLLLHMDGGAPGQNVAAYGVPATPLRALGDR